LLTGASGLLGRAFVRQFEHTSELLATAFSRTTPPLRRLDLRCVGEVETLMQDFRPQLVLHSAAERRPDICEHDHGATDALNVSAVETLAMCAKETGAALLCLSTDYVFDGTEPPYGVDDPPAPLNYYGKSKRAGELAALDSGAHACILRVPILYGPVEHLAESAVTSIALVLQQDGEHMIDHWAVRYPTHVDDVAAAAGGLAKLLEQGRHIPRILHFSGAEAFTKFEMARAIAASCGLDGTRIKAESRAPDGVPRPRNCHLDDSLLAGLVPVRKRLFRDVIGGVVKPHLD